MFELANKTMVLVGVGAVGSRTAKIAMAFGMNVIGVCRNPDIPAPNVTKMVGPTQLLDVLQQADFVVVTAPLTAENARMFDQQAFAVVM
ncbi:hypothetical protein KFU94_34600 [Chloroflexi bacterium TSY]|nr:hypothetical protein [Chloroflexi bacterium TSY]